MDACLPLIGGASPGLSFEPPPRRADGSRQPLTHEQEIECGRLVRDYRDVRARNLLVECNLRFAHWCIRRCRNRDDYSDVAQSAFMGLVRAADLFDPERGFRFGTYALLWVRQYAVRRDDLERPEQHFKRIASFDGERELDDGGSFLVEVGIAGDADSHASTSAMVEALESQCNSELERRIVYDRILAGATLEEIAVEFAVSRESVRQRESGLLARARRALGVAREVTHGPR